MATTKKNNNKKTVYVEPKGYFPKEIQKILDEGAKKKTSKGNKK